MGQKTNLLTILRNLGLSILVFGLLAACGRLNDSEDMIVERGIVYATGATQSGARELTLNYFAPSRDCPAPRPTIVYIHSGGYVVNDLAEAEFRGFTQLFLAQGYNFVTIGHRVINHKPVPGPAYAGMIPVDDRYPAEMITTAAAAVEDTVQALRWVENTATQRCHARGQIVLMGSSSGGISAINATYAIDDFGISRPRVRGVIANCSGHHLQGTLARGDVPLFLVHGGRDSIVPIEEAEQLWAETQATRTPAQFYTFANKGHCTNLRFVEAGGQAIFERMLEFTESALRGRRIQTVRIDS